MIDALDWYIFPIEMQKMLPTILIEAQQLVALECFGSILCSREVFKQVSENVDIERTEYYSDIMILRQIHFFR